MIVYDLMYSIRFEDERKYTANFQLLHKDMSKEGNQCMIFQAESCILRMATTLPSPLASTTHTSSTWTAPSTSVTNCCLGSGGWSPNCEREARPCASSPTTRPGTRR